MPVITYREALNQALREDMSRDDRVFHQKFGYGRVRYVEGNKLTVEFDKAGEKRVIDQFVSRA